MTNQKIRNQIHNPQKKSKRVVNNNERVRLWLKDGNATMLLMSGLTKNGAKVFINSMKEMSISLNCKIECVFLITK